MGWFPVKHVLDVVRSAPNAAAGWPRLRALCERRWPRWVDELEWYGKSHLIAGLKAMHREYSRPRWSELYSAADYVLFLGYSGLVLADACGAVRWKSPALVVWGFHDGDLFRLGRVGITGFQRLARP